MALNENNNTTNGKTVECFYKYYNWHPG